MPVTISGTTGVTTPGLASAAMPTSGGDPVVESGSNSDGEWTRFADGTQTLFTVKVPVSLTSGISGERTFLFPIPFINTDYWYGGSQQDTHNDARAAATNVGRSANANSLTTSQVILKASSDLVANFTCNFRVAAIGRWK